MQAQKQIQQLLAERLTQVRIKNPAFSVRAFARQLKIGPAALSEILNGKRQVSRPFAERLAERLCLDPIERAKILDAFPDRARRKPGVNARAARMLQLDMDHFRIISDWYHFGILSLAETAGFRDEPAWIAARLGIAIRDAESALDRLERLDLLRRLPQGRLVPTGVQYTTSDDISNLSLRKAHAQNLELARVSLETDPVDARDFTAITMAIDPAKLPEAKRRIREFRNELCAFLESGDKTEVYKLSVQMIPLSKAGSRMKSGEPRRHDEEQSD